VGIVDQTDPLVRPGAAAPRLRAHPLPTDAPVRLAVTTGSPGRGCSRR
jgi:hypothetical protein